MWRTLSTRWQRPQWWLWYAQGFQYGWMYAGCPAAAVISALSLVLATLCCSRCSFDFAAVIGIGIWHSRLYSVFLTALRTCPVSPFPLATLGHFLALTRSSCQTDKLRQASSQRVLLRELQFFAVLLCSIKVVRRSRHNSTAVWCVSQYGPSYSVHIIWSGSRAVWRRTTGENVSVCLRTLPSLSARRHSTLANLTGGIF